MISRLHEGIDVEEVAEAAWNNTVELFGMEEEEDYNKNE